MKGKIIALSILVCINTVFAQDVIKIYKRTNDSLSLDINYKTNSFEIVKVDRFPDANIVEIYSYAEGKIVKITKNKLILYDTLHKKYFNFYISKSKYILTASNKSRLYNIGQQLFNIEDWNSSTGEYQIVKEVRPCSP